MIAAVDDTCTMHAGHMDARLLHLSSAARGLVRYMGLGHTAQEHLRARAAGEMCTGAWCS